MYHSAKKTQKKTNHQTAKIYAYGIRLLNEPKCKWLIVPAHFMILAN